MGGVAVSGCKNCPQSILIPPIRLPALHRHHYHWRNSQQWRPCWTSEKRNNHSRLLTRGAFRCSAGGGSGNAIGIGSSDVEWEGGNASLEQRVFDFMQSSDKPNDFPTKDELLKAGHSDLVNAIIAHGGWLAAGWDSEELPTMNSSDNDEEECIALVEEDEDCVDGEFQKPSFQNPIDVSAEEVATMPAETGDGDESGIAGMLNRLKRERSRFYSDVSAGEKRGKKSTHSTESWNGVHGLQSSSVNGKRKVDARSVGSKESQGTLQSVGRDPAQPEYENTDLDFGDNFVKLKGWEIPRLERMEDKEVETKGEQGFSRVFWKGSGRTGQNMSSKTMHMDDKTSVVVDKINGTTDKRPEWTLDVKKTYSGDSQKINSRDAPNPIISRIQNLEFQLSSTLGLLRSGNDAIDVNKASKRSFRPFHKEGPVGYNEDDQRFLDEFEKASDVLEFRETEIMKTRVRLRSTHAKLAALEGKMTMEILEVRKAIEEKQRKLDEAQKVLRLMRSVRIVWPNSATEVLLAGSFDGWTSRKKMKKSNAGVFVISLQLYPGRYEIKFIVDGVWKVDPQRPVVYSNGFENNLLMIY